MKTLRSSTWMLALCLLVVSPARAQGPPVEQKAPELTKKSRLTRSRWKWKRVRHNYLLADGKKPVEKPAVMKARIEKYICLFLDMDGNGRFNDLGVDAWALTGMNYALPLEETTVVELIRVRWRIDADSTFVRFATEPVPVAKTQAKVLRQFNYWRLINGLCPADFDPALSEACRQHCAWMEQNGMKHYRAEGDSEMTPEGEQAGRMSMLSEEKPGMSILMIYASFYHRLPLMNPGTRAIGIGTSRRYTAVDGKTRVEMRPWNYPVIVPAPASALQPTHCPPESPRPCPAQVPHPGCPITLTFDSSAITDAKATLRLRRGRGAVEVPVLVSSPEHPANQKRPHNQNSICIIPRQPLLPRSLYGVVVTYKRNGEAKQVQWVFTTGRRRPVWRR